MCNGKLWLWVTMLALAGGCSTPSGAPTRVLTYRLGSEAVQSRVPKSGVYRVSVSQPSARHPADVPHTKVWLREGVPLGFKVDADHRLVALGGEYVLPVELPVSGAMAIAWYRLPNRPATSGKPDPFTNGVDPGAKPEDSPLDGLQNDPHEFHHKR